MGVPILSYVMEEWDKDVTIQNGLKGKIPQYFDALHTFLVSGNTKYLLHQNFSRTVMNILSYKYFY